MVHTCCSWTLLTRCLRKFLLLVLLLLGLSAWKRIFPIHIDVTSDDLLDLTKCPACFGVSMCHTLLAHHITLEGWTRYSIATLINIRNVYYGSYHGKRVVLKKLGHDWELRELDHYLCHQSKLSEGCDIKTAVQTLGERYFDTKAADKLTAKREHVAKGTDLVLCPSQRKTDYIFEKMARSSGQGRKTTLSNFLTLLLLNPEPLLLQAFPAEDGWPVPKYYGACGRVSIVEYVGSTLTHFRYDTWRRRANYAHQLLKLGERFTDNQLNFNLYLTDVASHNFCVDDSGTVKLVDFENIVVVDREEVRKGKLDGWNQTHVSFGYGCPDCFSFSIDDLCTHEISDHNYYAICQGLLAPQSYSQDIPEGLLHDIPEDILKKYASLPSLLEECGRNTGKRGRFQAAYQLMKILARIMI